MSEESKSPNPPPADRPPLPPKRGKAIDSALDRFYAAIDAIRDLDENLTPRAKALDQERLSPAALAAVRRLSSQKQTELRTFLESAPTDEGEARPASKSREPASPKPTDPQDGEEPVARIADEAQPDTSATNEHPLEETSAEPDPNVPKLQSILDSRWMALEFAQHVYRSALSPFREQMLRSALFVTAFGAFEMLVGSIAREYFIAYPGAIGDDPKFTLKDLESFDSLDDARTAAISVRLDALLAEDLERWQKWLEDRLSLKIPNLCLDPAELAEMYQRRHIHVHNEGKASRLYLKRLADALDPPDLGDALPVTSEYLERALDQLDTLGSLLGSGAWAKLFPDEEDDAMGELDTRAYDLMIRGRWNSVRHVSSVARHAKTNASQREVFRANYWLAEKRLGNFAAVAKDVEGWDVTALRAHFLLARYALLDELDPAFELAPHLLTSGQIAEKDLADWPLLTEFRADGRYAPLMEKHAAGSD